MSETSCIQCGQPSGTPLRLNHLPNGLPCPVCRDRLLESLPAPFGGARAEDEIEEPVRSFEPRYLAGGEEWKADSDDDQGEPA
ncbi:MAG: hypothetical protein H6831_09505 [Planctomycetes bacterium]|nr:hypothetical protein [Planctomycetota bacterium]MCB9904630.1 hypothetical protein [Planctomycetota bacterium]